MNSSCRSSRQLCKWRTKEDQLPPGTDLQQDAEEILHLLFSLDSSEPWTIEHVTLEPFSITVLTPPLDGAKFLLKLDLTPGQYHWLLLGVQVVPLS